MKWILGGIVCVGVGIWLLAKYYSGLPALEQLSTVTGIVKSADVETRRTGRMQSKHLAVRIGDEPTAYYMEHFPDYERVVATVKPGDRVTAWIDGKNNYIWQLEREGERLATYDQVAEMRRSNDFHNALFGILFIVVGVSTIGAMAWQWKQGSQAQPDTGDPPSRE